MLISVVIPAYNEAAWLPACLDSLNDQQAAPQFEVIVVDNASTDNTGALANRLVNGRPVRLVHEPQPGVCAARQAGLLAARGDIVVSTDADCTYPTDWLASVAACFQKQPDVVLRLGNYRFAGGQRALNRLLAAWEGVALRWKFGLDRHCYVSAANLAFRRSAFSGYDAALTQGGDELFVVSQLRQAGRVTYDFRQPVMTSARRLQTGFGRVLIKDFLVGYIWRYWRRHSGKSNQAHRQQITTRFDLSLAAVGLVVVMAVGLVGWAASGLLRGSPHGRIIVAGLFLLGLGILAYGLFVPSSQLLGPQVWRVPTARKVIALTFDDGPNGEASLRIAGIVESYGGQASFFQVGRCIERWPEVTRQLAAAGHLIANHTWRHTFSDYLRPGRLLAGIAQTSSLIERQTGHRPQYVRLPWLLRTGWLLRAVRRQGLEPLSGQFAVVKEYRQPAAETMAAAAYKKCRPGAVLIFHDGYNDRGADRSETVAAVRILAARLAAEGYGFVAIDELVC